jgi:hypothetical protein
MWETAKTSRKVGHADSPVGWHCHGAPEHLPGISPIMKPKDASTPTKETVDSESQAKVGGERNRIRTGATGGTIELDGQVCFNEEPLEYAFRFSELPAFIHEGDESKLRRIDVERYPQAYPDAVRKTPHDSGIDRESNGPWFVADRRNHFQIQRQMTLSLKSDANWEANLKVIRDASSLPPSMSNPGDDETNVTADRDLCTGRRCRAGEREQG